MWCFGVRGSVPEMFHDGVFQIGEIGLAEQAEPRSKLVVEIRDVPPGGNLAVDEVADPDRKKTAQQGHSQLHRSRPNFGAELDKR